MTAVPPDVSIVLVNWNACEMTSAALESIGAHTRDISYEIVVIDNGSTRFDYTNYIASAPVSALEPILWLEAGRMKTLNFSTENLANQRDVV